MGSGTSIGIRRAAAARPDAAERAEWHRRATRLYEFSARMRGALLTLSVAAELAATGTAAAPEVLAHNHLPPRQALEIGDVAVSHRYLSQGAWWGSGTIQECALTAIDPASHIRPFAVPRGRYRLKGVYRTPVRPEVVVARVFTWQGEGGRRHVRLRPRREGGEVVAWVARFRAKVRDRTRVLLFAGWRDENGCGREYVESFYPLRGLGPRSPEPCRCREPNQP